MDPVTKEVKKEPLKQFMVSQLTLTFERERIILSPFDEILHKQLIDYHVQKISQTGLPIFSSKDEHFVDALGLAHLAFVLKFPELTQAIKMPEFSTRIMHSSAQILTERANNDLRQITLPDNPWGQPLKQVGKAPGERVGDYQKWVKVSPAKYRSNSSGGGSWGGRGGGSSGGGRSLW